MKINLFSPKFEKTPFLVLFILFTSISTIAQTNFYSNCGTLIGSDDCNMVNFVSVSEIDGQIFSNENATLDFADELEGFCGPLTTVFQNIWIGFTPQQEAISFEFEILDCSSNGGIQAAIIKGNCQSNQFDLPSSSCINCVTNDFLLIDNLTIGDTYYLMIDGCFGDFCSFQINVDKGLPSANFTSSLVAEPSCLTLGNTTTLTAFPFDDTNQNYFYTWYNADDEEIQGENSPELVVSQAGFYTVKIQDILNDCTASSATILVNNNSLALELIPTNNGEINCESQEIQINAMVSGAPDINYEWSSSSMFSTGNGFITTEQAGTYNLVITDGNGCTAEASVSIVQNVDIPSLSVAPNPPACTGEFGELTITANGSSFLCSI